MIKQVISILIILSTLGFSSLSAAEEYVESLPSDTASQSAAGDPAGCPKLPVGLIFDKNLSAVSGASFFKTLLRGYQGLDESLFPDSQGDKSAYMMLGRFGKWVLEDALFSTMMIGQHEVFGHGARAREFHLHISRYRVTPWSGYVKYSSSKYNQLSSSEKVAFIAGGMEGTSILAKRVRDQFFDCNLIDQRAAHLYAVSMLDQPLYILGTKKEDTFKNDGNDVNAYIKEVNNWHGNNAISHKKLRRYATMDFVDPFFFYSIYTMGQYIYDGSSCWDFPMFNIGEYKYLPGLRTALAPYGPETQFINYIKGIDQTIQATFRYGKTGSKQSMGAALEVLRLYSADLLNVDGRLDVWQQPKLFIAAAHQAPRQFGSALSFTGRYRLSNCIEVLGQVGYKSKGYIPGESLKQSPILRVGLNADM